MASALSLRGGLNLVRLVAVAVSAEALAIRQAVVAAVFAANLVIELARLATNAQLAPAFLTASASALERRRLGARGELLAYSHAALSGANVAIRPLISGHSGAFIMYGAS